MEKTRIKRERTWFQFFMSVALIAYFFHTIFTRDFDVLWWEIVGIIAVTTLVIWDLVSLIRQKREKVAKE